MLATRELHPVPGIWVHHAMLPLDSGVRRELERALGPAEAARFATLARDEDRQRTLLAHGALRSLLRARHPSAPDAATLTYETRGRPILPTPGPSISLSHAGDHGLCASSSAGPVGVDVEVVRRYPELDGVARRVCADVELEQMQGPVDDTWLDAFYRRWVGKEAVLKAMGIGLAGDPRAVVLDLADHPAALRLTALGRGVELRYLDLGPDVRAAVAWLVPQFGGGGVDG